MPYFNKADAAERRELAHEVLQFLRHSEPRSTSELRTVIPAGRTVLQTVLQRLRVGGYIVYDRVRHAWRSTT